MSPSEASAEPTINRLLAALPAPDYERLLPELELVASGFKEVVHEPGSPLSFVYFPVTSVFSLLTLMTDGAAVEYATVGREGMIGVPAFLGADTIRSRAFPQVPGDSVRMRVEVFQGVVNDSGPFRRALLRYTHALLNQIVQTSACNRLHSLAERCSRWLLMTHERVGRDQFVLTQETLGELLGVRRQSVNAVASRFQQAGLIRYRYGQITVLDRQGLEAAACECYGLIRREFDGSFD